MTHLKCLNLTNTREYSKLLINQQLNKLFRHFQLFVGK